MRLFGIFAGLAIVLAVVGIYGVMSYSVNRRTHEIGVAIGIAGSLALARLIARFL